MHPRKVDLLTRIGVRLHRPSDDTLEDRIVLCDTEDACLYRFRKHGGILKVIEPTCVIRSTIDEQTLLDRDTVAVSLRNDSCSDGDSSSTGTDEDTKEGTTDDTIKDTKGDRPYKKCMSVSASHMYMINSL